MNTKYPASQPVPLNGFETFVAGKLNAGFQVVDFWSWSFSSLLNNVTRGHLAEFIVARALDIADGVRQEWANYDLLLKVPARPDVKIEVKSAAYFQEWKQEELSTIQFSIRKTKAFDVENGCREDTARRQSDVYVFALLSPKIDKPAVNPLDLSQWDFYVVPTSTLDRLAPGQASISLSILTDEKSELHTPKTDFFKLHAAVVAAACG